LTDTLGLTEDILSPDKLFIATRFLETLKIFGAATVPLAFLIAGSRIAAMKGFNIRHKNVIIITFLRMVIIPIAFLSLLSLFPIPKDVLFVITIVATMPCALASFIFSELYGGDKEFITTTVLITHLISFITVPILLNIYLPTL
jgi:predicted permease